MGSPLTIIDYVMNNAMLGCPLFALQQLLKVLEDESKSAAQKPRVMKKFFQTTKAEKVVANAKNTNKQAPPSSVEELEEDERELPVEQEVVNGGGSVSASPRNKLLNKLALRGRGGARSRKAASTTTSKKPKE